MIIPRAESQRGRITASPDQLRTEASRIKARKGSAEEILSHRAYTTESVKRLFTAIERGEARRLPAGGRAGRLRGRRAGLRESHRRLSARGAGIRGGGGLELTPSAASISCAPTWTAARRSWFDPQPGRPARRCLDLPGRRGWASSAVLGEVNTRISRMVSPALQKDHAVALGFAASWRAIVVAAERLRPNILISHLLPDGAGEDHGHAVSAGEVAAGDPGVEAELREIELVRFSTRTRRLRILPANLNN